MTNSGGGRRNIVLAGFMGTGKTSVGRIVAEKLNMGFLDTDTEVEKEVGKSIAEIFATGSEAGFRRLESAICQQAAQMSHQVIATGGGALLDASSRAALEQSGLIICLTCNLTEILRRIGEGSSRPLYAGDAARLERLFNERDNLYRSLPYQIDTTTRTPKQVAEEVIRLWQSA